MIQTIKALYLYEYEEHVKTVHVSDYSKVKHIKDTETRLQKRKAKQNIYEKEQIKQIVQKASSQHTIHYEQIDVGNVNDELLETEKYLIEQKKQTMPEGYIPNYQPELSGRIATCRR